MPDKAEILFNFWPKRGEIGPKILFFFNLSKNLVINFFWVYSLRKVYIICCVPAQIPYLGKIWFLKDSWPIRMSNFYINHVSKAKSWKNLIFLHLYKFMKISWIEIFSVGIVKSGCCFSGLGFYLFINDLPKWRVFKYSRITNILVLPSWPVRSSYLIVYPELSGNPTVPARLNWFFVCSSFISCSDSINHHHAVGPVRFSLNWSGFS